RAQIVEAVDVGRDALFDGDAGGAGLGFAARGLALRRGFGGGLLRGGHGKQAYHGAVRDWGRGIWPSRRAPAILRPWNAPSPLTFQTTTKSSTSGPSGGTTSRAARRSRTCRPSRPRSPSRSS